jgi:hypothetical protein
MFCLQCGKEVKYDAKLITKCHAVALMGIKQ